MRLACLLSAGAAPALLHAREQQPATVPERLLWQHGGGSLQAAHAEGGGGL